LQNSTWTAAALLATLEHILQHTAGLEVSLRRPRTPPDNLSIVSLSRRVRRAHTHTHTHTHTHDTTHLHVSCRLQAAPLRGRVGAQRGDAQAVGAPGTGGRHPGVAQSLQPVGEHEELRRDNHHLWCVGFRVLRGVDAPRTGCLSQGGRGEARRELIRVRVKIMGSQKCGIVGKSQSVLIMIDPMISTRTRSFDGAARDSEAPSTWQRRSALYSPQ
jgi:hypothetical protein